AARGLRRRALPRRWRGRCVRDTHAARAAEATPRGGGEIMTANLTAAEAASPARSAARRHSGARAWLAGADLDALIAYGSGLHAFTGTNPAWYLSAFKQIGPHAAVIVPQRGEPLLVMTPAWDAPRYRERATMELVAVAPDEFLATVAAAIKRRG